MTRASMLLAINILLSIAIVIMLTIVVSNVVVDGFTHGDILQTNDANSLERHIMEGLLP